MKANVSGSTKASAEEFLITKLEAEYALYNATKQMVDRTVSFYLAGISTIIAVFIVLLKGFWDKPPIDYDFAFISIATVSAIGAGYGSLTFLRLVNQRGTLVALELRIRAIEHYFVSGYPAVRQYLIQHTGDRLDQKYLVIVYFSSLALTVLSVFAAWNSLLLAVTGGLTAYVVLSLLPGLDPRTNVRSALGVGTVIFAIWLAWGLKTLINKRISAGRHFSKDYQMALTPKPETQKTDA